MYPVTLMKINHCPIKVNMIDKTDYLKNTQKAVNDGMETFLNWGNAAIDNTFSMYEQGIKARDTNIAEARKQFQELESSLTQKWENQKEQFKSMTIELSQAYWPESRQLMEQVEKFFEDNINVVVQKNRKMLESSIDSSVKINLNVEKKWVSQLRENYTRGSENLRKQFDSLVSQAAETTATKETTAPNK
jgi:GTP1/Obg family GTP-binding protein